MFAPVKSLSSGMSARLGFAIATDVQPDILILDEVLSVGDESFKNKCQKRIDKLWDHHTTILVVSHGLEFIQQSCERAIWLDRGKIRFAGSTEETIRHYLESVH
jgi:lipopolysaccharide transport system ATP-binding protein